MKPKLLVSDLDDLVGDMFAVHYVPVGLSWVWVLVGQRDFDGESRLVGVVGVGELDQCLQGEVSNGGHIFLRSLAIALEFSVL